MDEAEVISAAHSIHAKKRWANAGAEKRQAQGRRLLEGRATVITEPRPQDTRVTQVFAPKPAKLEGRKRIAIHKRVAKLMTRAEREAPLNDYLAREFRRSVLTLQEYAREFDQENQREKAVQIHIMLVKHLKGVANDSHPSGVSPEEEARIEAEVRAMSDEELARND